MIDLSKAEIRCLAVHLVGNKLRQEGVKFSNKETPIEGERLQELLFQHFLKPFIKVDSLHQFTHESNLAFNEIYVYSKYMFSNPRLFLQTSQEIAKHLYDKSSHPRIRNGEFFMLHISNCTIDGTTTDALGIFKSETKDTYLKIAPQENTYGITLDEGISINRLEKGCLVFNLDVDSGYRVIVIDNLNKNGEEARYWKEQFLRVRELGNDDSVTKRYMGLVTRVIDDSLSNKNVEDRIRTQLRAMSYFDKNSSFDNEQFTKDIFSEWPNASEEYLERKRTFQDKEGINLPEKFNISRQVVERFKRTTKRTIQLDDSFEIIIKTNEPEHLTKLIRDFDEEQGMFYYKVYFTSER